MLRAVSDPVKRCTSEGSELRHQPAPVIHELRAERDYLFSEGFEGDGIGGALAQERISRAYGAGVPLQEGQIRVMGLGEQKVDVTPPAAGGPFHELDILRAKNHRPKNTEELGKLSYGMTIHGEFSFPRGPIHFDLMIARVMSGAADEKPGLPVANQLGIGHSAEGTESREQVNRLKNVSLALCIVPEQEVKTRAEFHIQSRVVAKVAQPEVAQMHGEQLPAEVERGQPEKEPGKTRQMRVISTECAMLSTPLRPYLALWLVLLTGSVSRGESYAEKLGWKPTDIVLILHVDDVGMSHSSNAGWIEASEKGLANSFSIMMPCPWVPEIALYLKERPHLDAGLHLTLTSEWKLYRWGPLAGKSAVPGLVDEQGCLWRSVELVTQHASADEVEVEIRAQIERAEQLGINITHLDSHMGTLFARRDYFERFAKVGIEKQIPILAAGGHLTHAARENPRAVEALKPMAKKIWDSGLPVLDDVHTATYDWSPAEKKQRFLELIRELKPGLTEILFHCSIPTDVFPLITSSSESRHADAQILMDGDVETAMMERQILFTTWRELKDRRAKVR